MAQRRQADAGLNRRLDLYLNPRRRAALVRLAGAAGAAAMGAGGLAGCAGPRRPVVPERSVDGGPFVLPLAAPASRVGERWRYREINGYNGAPIGTLEHEVLSTAPLTLAQRRLDRTPAATAVSTLRDERVIRFDGPWSALVDASFDHEYSFSPAVPWLPPRLAPGEPTSSRHRFTVPGNSGNYGWQQRLVATAAEIIDTPAGRFDTLLIQRSIRFDSPDPFRYDCDRQETRWYAPAVNGFVRRIWTGSYLEDASIDMRGRRREDWIIQELIDYRPGRD